MHLSVDFSNAIAKCNNLNSPNNYSTEPNALHAAASSTSLSLSPSSSESSLVMTPSHSPCGVYRVLDENYDEGNEDRIMANHHRHLNRLFGIQSDMSCNEEIERITAAMPSVWTVNDAQPRKEHTQTYQFTINDNGTPVLPGPTVV